MKIAEIATVVIRLVALWMIVHVAGTLLTNVAWMVILVIQGGPAGISSINSQFIGLSVYVAAALVYVGAAVALFLLAPRVGRLISRSQDAASTSIDVTRIGAGQAYHIATFVTGVILVTTAIRPAAQGVAGLLTTSAAIRWAGGVGGAYGLVNMVEAVTRAAFGVFLMFGAKQIAFWMASLRYDPDNVPNQRISLRLLLVLATVIAVVLILMRFLVQS